MNRAASAASAASVASATARTNTPLTHTHPAYPPLSLAVVPTYTTPNFAPQPPTFNPVHVYFYISLFKITHLSTTDATVDFAAWVYMNWYDGRLRWDPKCYGGATETWLYASHDKELTDIWVPDIALYNINKEGMDTWGEKMATVTR